MTKNIEIVTEPKKQKPGRKFTFCTNPVVIAEKLKDFVRLESIQDANILIPGKTVIRYIQKKDKGLRNDAHFIKVIGRTLLVKVIRSERLLSIGFENNKIYCSLEDQEKGEKIRFLDFLKMKMDMHTIDVHIHGSRVTWEELITYYGDETI